MSCHAVGKVAASKPFVFAGTVFKTDGTPQTNAAVKLMNPGLTMEIRNMKTDANGNFYSLEPLSSLSIMDLHPVVSVGNRDLTMNVMLISGNCNSCHVAGGMGRKRIEMD